MAIIIGAISLIFVAICGYIMHCIKNVRRIEKWFYDILFLTEFFREIIKREKFDTLIQKNGFINVTRKISILSPNCDKDNIHIFEIGNEANESGNQEKVAYLTYEFKANLETITIAIKVREPHMRLIKSFANTHFTCSIDKRKIKMTLDDFAEKTIYISSEESIYQNLALALQNNEIRFKEEYIWFWSFLNEVIVLPELIEKIRDFLLTNNDT